MRCSSGSPTPNTQSWSGWHAQNVKRQHSTCTTLAAQQTARLAAASLIWTCKIQGQRKQARRQSINEKKRRMAWLLKIRMPTNVEGRVFTWQLWTNTTNTPLQTQTDSPRGLPFSTIFDDTTFRKSAPFALFLRLQSAVNARPHDSQDLALLCSRIRSDQAAPFPPP